MLDVECLTLYPKCLTRVWGFDTLLSEGGMGNVIIKERIIGLWRGSRFPTQPERIIGTTVMVGWFFNAVLRRRFLFF